MQPAWYGLYDWLIYTLQKRYKKNNNEFIYNA